MSVEEDLTRTLGRWGAASVVVGAALSTRPRTRAFGRQTAAWGAVDAAIALVGARRRAARGPTDPARLRRVLLVNAGLDVGYVLAGLHLVFRTDRATASRSNGCTVRRSRISTSIPSRATAAAASRAHRTPTP